MKIAVQRLGMTFSASSGWESRHQRFESLALVLSVIPGGLGLGDGILPCP
jgi:hypothetical protein